MPGRRGQLVLPERLLRAGLGASLPSCWCFPVVAARIPYRVYVLVYFRFLLQGHFLHPFLQHLPGIV
jgi:hypothetical protein